MDPICPDCGHRHGKKMAHIFPEPAINERLTDAINKEVMPNARTRIRHSRKSDVRPDTVTGVAHPSSRTPNRRLREKYNAYMREYMKRK